MNDKEISCGTYASFNLDGRNIPNSGTTFSPNGFAALASSDSNNDGIIDANDPAFAQLKLWRDTYQDGTVNQSTNGAGSTNTSELISLTAAGIVSLNLANVLKNQATGNGNTLTREGSFTKQVSTLDTATGQTITQTVTQTMGEYNLAINTFDTQFKDNITVSDSAKTLPNMQGSGNVRDLQQAATQSSTLQNLLTQFSTATTRTAQKALLDQIMLAWADTSGMAKSLTEQAAGKFTYTKCTSTRLPKAAAYLRKVPILGECLPDASALSSLATAGALVPIRSATSACDKPAARLAASISSNMANSSRFKRSYSALTAGLSSIFAFSSACVNTGSAFMFNLLHSVFSQSQFTPWRSLRFFNKTMQHQNTLPNQSAIKYAGNTFSTFKSQLKQTIAKRFGMWLTQISTKYFHTVSQSKVAATQAFWQSQNLSLHGIAVINNGVWHVANNNKYVIKRQVVINLMAANDGEWRVVA